MTEMGCAWLPPMLRTMATIHGQIRDTGQTGEIRYNDASS